MHNVKLFKKSSLDFTADKYHSSINALVNVGNSSHLGAGIGTFDAGCNIEWTVTYDEVLFIHSGFFELRVENKAFMAGPGDVLWIPANSELTYKADEDVTFFYAVYPVEKSPSTNTDIKHPESEAQAI